MPKISKKASALLSLILAIAVTAVIAVMMVALPFLIDSAPMMQEIKSYFSEKALFGMNGSAVFWTWLYFILTAAAVCCVVLVLLLLRVRRGLVFTDKTVSFIRFISWGCLLIALACLLVVYYFHMAYLLSLATGFLGLCLRVVKNVIEEATAIKNENDLTV